MKLTVFNGSPKGKKGNTQTLLDHFLSGFLSGSNNTCETFYLNEINGHEVNAINFSRAEHILMAMPLYHDSMPAVVKAFIEMLPSPSSRDVQGDIFFIIQSGFPEANHSRYLERYFKKLATRISRRYLGTIIKGGCNDISHRSDWMAKKIFKSLYGLGKFYGNGGSLDQKILHQWAEPETLKGVTLLFLKTGIKLGFMQSQFDRMLKKNRAYERRFDKPFLDSKEDKVSSKQGHS
ncbi:MAG: NAD(P)H-dependent oxidoreductase [Thermodesulfobacteriota bacterium]